MKDIVLGIFDRVVIAYANYRLGKAVASLKSFEQLKELIDEKNKLHNDVDSNDELGGLLDDEFERK